MDRISVEDFYEAVMFLGKCLSINLRKSLANVTSYGFTVGWVEPDDISCAFTFLILRWTIVVGVVQQSGIGDWLCNYFVQGVIVSWCDRIARFVLSDDNVANSAVDCLWRCFVIGGG